jgi:hypothetical protein
MQQIKLIKAMDDGDLVYYPLLTEIPAIPNLQTLDCYGLKWSLPGEHIRQLCVLQRRFRVRRQNRSFFQFWWLYKNTDLPQEIIQMILD